MSIGATLAAARRRAGLTVSDVSHSTRVTEPIIRGIEHDDYAACGGDFYARGHIRAIARAVGEDPAPLIDEFDSTWRTSQQITAAEAFGPSMPIRRRERRRVRWTALLAVLVLAVLGFAGYKFASGASRGHRPSATASPGRHASATGPRPSPAVQSGTAITSSVPSASPSPSASVTTVATQVLAPASVAAFGPAGTADGDGPQRAALAIAGRPATPWYSDWYSTPDFGRLQAGTGLLLDMGRAVTVSSVRVWMTSPGAGLQLRAGSSPGPGMTKVATAADAGRAVRLQPGLLHARYLLLWFTRLPPDRAGTYQVGVYQITVEGQS